MQQIAVLQVAGSSPAGRTMAKEKQPKVIYYTRYLDAYPIRRRIPYAERMVEVVRRTSWGRNTLRYQILGTLTAQDRDRIIGRFNQKLPLRNKLGEDEILGTTTLQQLIDQINNKES